MQALVLSAGGLFGAWQAGAWRVLAERFRPDLVVGASAGALNGWVIAGGRPPGDLIAYWDRSGLGRIMRLRTPWPPWNGIFDPAAIEELAREMFAASTPRVPFALTLVEVPRLRPVLVRGDEVTWRHLLAACAVPFGFPPVRIEGRTYVDGGLLGALPLWAAAELGATAALAVDALPRMPSRTIRSAVRLAQALALRPAPAPLVTVRLAPSRPLGPARHAIRYNAARLRAWIEMGARDAEALLATSPPIVSASRPDVH